MPSQGGVFHFKKNVHQPVRLGLCTSCHNPHASSHDALLSGDPSAICYSCHDRRRRFYGRGRPQAPRERGKCLDCTTRTRAIREDFLRQPAPRCVIPAIRGRRDFKKTRTRKSRRAIVLSATNRMPQARRGFFRRRRRISAKTATNLLARSSPLRTKVIRWPAGAIALRYHNPHSSDLKGMTKAFLAPFKEDVRKCHVKGSDKVVSAGTCASMP